MGNYKFRLSDMMPNAWFYKLKDMGRASRKQGLSHRAKKTHHQRLGEPTTPKSFPSPHPHPPSSKQAFLPNRASYYYPRRTETEKLPSSPIHPKASDTHFLIDPPRKSKRRSRRKLSKPSTKLVTTSVSAGCNCRVLRTESSPVYTVTTPLESPPCHSPDHTKDEDDDSHKPFIADLDGIKSWITSSPTDIIIDMGSKSDMAFAREIEKLKDFDTVSEIELPPILTKPIKKEADPANFDEKGSYPNVIKSPARKSPAGLHRLRMRAISPRLATKKTQANRARRSFGSAAAATKQMKGISESFAIVKSSSDPQRDFRDSMVEMIVENNIRASKDLEELLACYLTLNSNEYHDVIVKVFEQIWFDLTDIIRL